MLNNKIFQDQNQVLFKACGAIEADMQCHEPIPVIFDTKCVFHLQLPRELKLEPMKVYKILDTNNIKFSAKFNFNNIILVQGREAGSSRKFDKK
jgi:hypothetical protein